MMHIFPLILNSQKKIHKFLMFGCGELLSGSYESARWMKMGNLEGGVRSLGCRLYFNAIYSTWLNCIYAIILVLHHHHHPGRIHSENKNTSKALVWVLCVMMMINEKIFLETILLFSCEEKHIFILYNWHSCEKTWFDVMMMSTWSLFLLNYFLLLLFMNRL